MMAHQQHMTMANYADYELFGPRAETKRHIDKLKKGNDSECVLYNIGTFASKEQTRLRNLIGTDRRIRMMIQGLGITHAMPIQRYSWPKIDKSTFANVFVSAEATGKTYAILLYAVTKCLSAAPISEVDELLNGEANRHVTSEHLTDLDDLIRHPKYIIICSSQDNVEMIHRTIDHMKVKAYDDHVPDAKRHLLTPIARTIRLDHDNDKLAQRCVESDILIGSPQVLTKCLDQGFITFNKCKQIFFDDLDVALQVQNSSIRELIKIYLIQSQTKSELTKSTDKPCRMQMFSRKWTELLKQFLSSVFSQRILLFGSIAEAAVYSNVRFEVESYERQKKDKIGVIRQLLVDYSKSKEKIAIICNTDDEAESVSKELSDEGFTTRLLKEPATYGTNGVSRQHFTTHRNMYDVLTIISDPALEFEVEYSSTKKSLNDIMHLIHASVPDDMLTFDQRFRLLYKNIQDSKSGMTSTLIVDTTSEFKLARQIYDIASRSPVTMKSTKFLLKSLISNQANQICWRWASTGLCRLEKLSRNDRFGSYCPDRHSIERNYLKKPIGCNNSWPEYGMVRISITHIVSPSEFYFLFEAFRKNDDGKWRKFEHSGMDHLRTFQCDLNALKIVPTRSIPLEKIQKGMIYGVYFPQESRVDRVRILDEPKHEGTSMLVNKDLEYSKQISIFKVDHGICLDVYVKNLIELPDALAKIPAQCHRGFHLGYRPPNNEPNWLYKSKKQFYDILNVNQPQDVTAWIRLNCEGCFWFESMLVSRRLTNIDSNDIWTIDPYDELRVLKLAERIDSEPPIMPASTRLETICRWNHVKLTGASQRAFLRRDVGNIDVFLLNIDKNLDVVVRQSTYNKQLIDLEQQLVIEFENGKLPRQEYLSTGVICIARIKASPLTTEVCLNRVQILLVNVPKSIDHDIESPNNIPEASILVECLDHGDKFWVLKNQLYQASITHIKILPFQAIKCELANLNKRLMDDIAVRNQLIDRIYDLTREDDQYKKLKCKLNQSSQLYLYIPNQDLTRYDPLYMLLLDNYQMELHDILDDVCRETLEPIIEAINVSDTRSCFVNATIIQLLRDIAEQSMKEAQLDQPQ